MALTILHTADWHLGRRFAWLPPEQELRLTRAHLDVVGRILDLAEQRNADAVLVAGDIFDGPTPDDQWWQGLQTEFRKRKWTRPVVLLPGNHDPLMPRSVFGVDHPFRLNLPKYVHVVDRDDFALPIGDKAVILSTPCRSHSGQSNLVSSLPQREPGDLEQYSTNSGTAIGMNAEEAIIHGLLEGIERTSLSKFLSDTFLKNKENHLRVVNSLTLPPNISDVVNRLEKEISSRIFVFEMPNKFGVPAYVSWMEQYEFTIGIAGYGCSLSAEHAILRCLYELSQYYLLSKHIFGFDWLRSKAEAIRTELKGLPLHQDCAVFDMGWKCRTLGCESVEYENLSTVPFANDPKEYLAQLTALIYENGEVPYASELEVLGNGINVTHTFITGEDRFFNVQNCKSTFPASLKDFAA